VQRFKLDLDERLTFGRKMSITTCGTDLFDPGGRSKLLSRWKAVFTALAVVS